MDTGLIAARVMVEDPPRGDTTALQNLSAGIGLSIIAALLLGSPVVETTII